MIRGMEGNTRRGIRESWRIKDDKIDLKIMFLEVLISKVTNNRRIRA